MISPKLLARVLGREESLFAPAVAQRQEELIDRIRSSRVLVIGAGGSIGSTFAKALAAYQPAVLHLVDLSENHLVALVRELHSQGIAPGGGFATYAIGFDEAEFYSYLRSAPRFDYVLNFAALKHVRSERDPFTAMRLLRVNVLANYDLQAWLGSNVPRRYFCVSSDKAASPASLMGASKTFMERVCLDRADAIPFSSARFANVAFSEGSLLQSFSERIARRQPLAAPNDVRRYFISGEEAAQLCLLACFLGGNGEIFIPSLQADLDLKTFSQIAIMLLEEYGYSPLLCDSEEAALSKARENISPGGAWPCYFSASNTAGEKPVEEFAGPGEQVESGRYPNINVVTHPTRGARDAITAAIVKIKKCRQAGEWTKEELFSAVQSVVPEFAHVAKDANLDNKL
ncbi:MAG TPA: polysaccharide biosynthesis protein [Verrucomicrobiae bacterium]|jgi:nucleoside-diphosphate-sugar epimerase